MTRSFIESQRARRKFSTEAMLALRDAGLTRVAAAERLGVSAHAIYVRLRAEGLDWPVARRPRFDDATFARLWSCHEITRDEIARAAGVTGQAVSARAKALGLPSRRHVRRRKHDPALLAEMWAAGVACSEIAVHFGMAHRSCVSMAARKLGLAPRVRGASGFRNGGWAATITLDQFHEDRLARALARAVEAERAAPPERRRA